jgi:hypothetical protein
MYAFCRYTAGVSLINEIEQVHFYESAKHFTRKSLSVMSGMAALIANREVERKFPLLILCGDKDTE